MRHVTIFRDDLKALNGLCVANDVVEEDRAVFLDPRDGGLVTCCWILKRSSKESHHGKSYVAPLGLALRALFVAAVEDSAFAMVWNMCLVTARYHGDTPH